MMRISSLSQASQSFNIGPCFAAATTGITAVAPVHRSEVAFKHSSTSAFARSHLFKMTKIGTSSSSKSLATVLKSTLEGQKVRWWGGHQTILGDFALKLYLRIFNDNERIIKVSIKHQKTETSPRCSRQIMASGHSKRKSTTHHTAWSRSAIRSSEDLLALASRRSCSWRRSLRMSCQSTKLELFVQPVSRGW